MKYHMSGYILGLPVPSSGYVLHILKNRPLEQNTLKASPEVYGTLEYPPLNRGLTLSLELSIKVHPSFDTLVTFDYTFEAHNSLFDI